MVTKRRAIKNIILAILIAKRRLGRTLGTIQTSALVSVPMKTEDVYLVEMNQEQGTFAQIGGGEIDLQSDWEAGIQSESGVQEQKKEVGHMSGDE